MYFFCVYISFPVLSPPDFEPLHLRHDDIGLHGLLPSSVHVRIYGMEVGLHGRSAAGWLGVFDTPQVMKWDEAHSRRNREYREFIMDEGVGSKKIHHILDNPTDLPRQTLRQRTLLLHQHDLPIPVHLRLQCFKLPSQHLQLPLHCPQFLSPLQYLLGERRGVTA